MRFTTLGIALVLGSTACAINADDPSLNSESQSVVANNRLSVNRLAVNRLAVNRLAVNRLAVNRLAVNRLQGNLDGMGDLLATAEGREVLTYIISCALPQEATLVADVPGGPYEFLGGIGLAPHWVDHPIDAEGKGWVSACLFARVNAHDVSVPVSIRGAHAALATGTAEAATWTLEEGAFYGNYFLPLDQPIVWIACRGRDQATGETGGLIDRDCAEPDLLDPTKTQCGFTYAGDCGDYAPPRNAVPCETFVSPHDGPNDTVLGGYYQNCAEGPSSGKNGHHHQHGHYDHDGDDHDRNGHDDDDDDGHGDHGRFHQVITTYVLP